MDRFKIETYLYDLRSVQKESDDPANAILFKSPSDISINKALARVGNFVALYQDVCFECHDKHRLGYQKLVRETGGKIVQA